jgi:hypothetical protein
MGSVKDIMEMFISRDIRTIFPPCEGWKYRQIPTSKNIPIMFLVSRTDYYKTQFAVVAISYASDTAPGCIAALYSAAKDRSDCVGKYLLVPQSIEMQHIPADILIRQMHAFGFVNGRLVWLTKKKNARRIVCEMSTPA